MFVVCWLLRVVCCVLVCVCCVVILDSALFLRCVYVCFVFGIVCVGVGI